MDMEGDKEEIKGGDGREWRNTPHLTILSVPLSKSLVTAFSQPTAQPAEWRPQNCCPSILSVHFRRGMLIVARLFQERSVIAVADLFVCTLDVFFSFFELLRVSIDLRQYKNSNNVAKPPQLRIAYARELTHLLAMVKRVPAAGLRWVYKPLQRSARRVGYYGGRST